MEASEPVHLERGPYVIGAVMDGLSIVRLAGLMDFCDLLDYRLR